MPINISSNFIIERDEVYTSASGAAFDAYGLNAIEFINYGTIRASGSNAVGFSSYISSGLIHNAGLMEVRSTDTGYGFSSPQWMAAIRNTGQVTVTGVNAYGLYTWSPGQVFDNAGTLTVTATAGATGLYLVNGDRITNTGSITVRGGTSATGVYIDRFEGNVFDNQGVIVASASGQSFGVVVSGLALGVTAPNIINHGTITAGIAIYGRDGGYSPSQPTIENVANYGVVNGAIVLGAGADVLRNYNIINGDVDMGAGADVVDLTGGWINGLIDLGEDDDVALGSADADVFFGYLGRDTIRGAGGDDHIEGEQGNDTLFGGDGDDVILGGSGSDTISGDDGNDTIEGGTGDDIIDGGAGTDTAVYSGASSDFTITTVNGVTTVSSSATGTDTLRATERLQFLDRVVLLGDSPSGPITGTAASEVLVGAGAADTLFGLGGDDTLIGNAGNDTLTGGSGADTMIGGQGDDIYEVTEAGDVVTEAAGEGADTVFSYLDSYALTANVERLALSGAARVGIGNAGDNTLIGNSGANTLIGGAGADTMIGGQGDDAYEVTEAGDVVVETAGEGTDTVYAYVDGYVLGANVERLELEGRARSGSTNSSGGTVVGNALDNTLIVGGGSAVLIGGGGSDTAVIEGARSGFTITTDSGVTTVTGAGRTITLASVERIQFSDQVVVLTPGQTLAGTGAGEVLSGADGYDTVYAHGGNDVLFGYGGNDVLIGGDGADIMVGGDGDDTYEVSETADNIQEAAGEGFDTVFAYANGYTLAANAESLRLVGAAATGYGNAGDNVLVGNGLDNLLVGGGGNDTFYGGAGDDTYEVAEAGDVVVENAGEGVDTIFSYVTYALGANVENLRLVGGALNATGNGLNNTIVGNDADNILIGGAGDDIMVGSRGNDAYEVTEAGDVVYEAAGEGTDTVYSYIDAYQMSLNVEALYLVGTARMGLGSAGADRIVGNAMNNVLNGNAGDDVLTGGAGVDQFWFLAGGGHDRITDFLAQSDPYAGAAVSPVVRETIVLSQSQFANFAAVQAAMTQSGADVVITVNGSQSLTLANVTMGQLTAANFAFYDAPATSPVAPLDDATPKAFGQLAWNPDATSWHDVPAYLHDDSLPWMAASIQDHWV